MSVAFALPPPEMPVGAVRSSVGTQGRVMEAAPKMAWLCQRHIPGGQAALWCP